MKRLAEHLSYANVIATVALFLALGGGAYAAISLPKNSVGTKQIKPNAVNGSKIANGSLSPKDFVGGLTPASAESSGPQGLPGAQGAQGTAGLDGAAIAVRARSTGSVETPTDGSQVTIPLSGNEWTQGAAELDLGPFGSFTYTASGPSSCGGAGLLYIFWSIEVGGVGLASGTTETLRDGATRSGSISSSQSIGRLLEPGAATQRIAVVKFFSGCESGPLHPAVNISDARFDLIRAS